MPGQLLRGEVWWADPDPIVGSEMAKRRPVVLIAHDTVNQRRKTVIAVPLSSRADAHPPISVAVSCMGRRVIAIIDQIQSIDKSRLVEYIEDMAADDLDVIREALLRIL